MKIESSNASSYLNHLKTLTRLGGVDEWKAEDLYKKLRRIEVKMNRLMCDECNGTRPGTEEENGEKDEKVIDRVKKLLPLATGVFLNCDPRGYSLKIKSEDVKALNEAGKINIYQDWGGYGILAPEF